MQLSERHNDREESIKKEKRESHFWIDREIERIFIERERERERLRKTDNTTEKETREGEIDS